MRILRQHLQPIFYAKYLGETEKMEEGLHTGQPEPIYGDVGFARVYISIPKRDAIVERNGVNTPYRKTIVSEKDLGLKETDLFSYGVAETDGDTAVEDYGVFNPWEVAKLTNGGVFNPWTPDGEVLYKIIRVAKSNHHTTYTIEEL